MHLYFVEMITKSGSWQSSRLLTLQEYIHTHTFLDLNDWLRRPRVCEAKARVNHASCVRGYTHEREIILWICKDSSSRSERYLVQGRVSLCNFHVFSIICVLFFCLLTLCLADCTVPEDSCLVCFLS